MTQRDYSTSKIYKIISKDLSHDLIYIGSTCKDLRKRLANHKRDWKRWKNGKYNYVKSFDLFNKGEVDIVLIENFPCKTKPELHARERYHIENTKCANKYIPGRTKKEYDEDHKDQKKKYYEDHKDHLKQPFKCECGATVQTRSKSNHLKTKKHLNFTKENQNTISV
jgi:hypothetical protein